MAYTEEAIARVIIDGKQAEKELHSLVLRANELKAELRTLKKEGSNTDSVQRELKQTQQAIKQMKQSLVDTDRVLSSLNTSTPRDLRQTLKQLQGELDTGRIERGSQKWKDYTASIRRLKEELRNVNRELSATTAKGSIFDRFNTMAMRYGPLLGSLTVGLNKLTGVLKNASREYALLTDVYADVQKYTGLTDEGVRSLNDSLKEIDTRTSREELNRLAADAGKLGIQGKEDILGFVEAADVIRVALGEDLGEDAVKNIGKLAELFPEGEGSLKEKMLASASAINALGQSSTASEPYILSFTSRLAGVGVQAGLTQTEIMGFASALDQDMQAVEMSATAIQQTLLDMFQEPAKYAKVMGVSVSDFSKMLKEDANGAFLGFLDSLSRLGGMDQIAPILADLELKGVRVSGVLSDLANNTDKVRDAQRIANDAYREGNSVLEEFALNNETEQAKLEKAQKQFKEIVYELGEKALPVLRNSVRLGSLLPKALLLILDTFNKYKISIITLTVAIGAYTVATNASIIADKAKVFWNNAIVASFNKVRLAMLKNPYTALAVAIVAVTAAIADYIRRAKETITIHEEIKKIKEEASKEVSSEIGQVRMLCSVIEDENSGYSAKKEAIKSLKEILPDYRAELTEEGKVIGHNTNLVEDYCKSLISMAQVRALSTRAGDLELQIFENDQRIKEKEEKLKTVKPGLGDYWLSSHVQAGGAEGKLSSLEIVRSGIRGEIEKLRRESNQAQKSIDSIEKEISSILGVHSKNSLKPTNPRSPNSFNGDNKKNKSDKVNVPSSLEVEKDLDLWSEEFLRQLEYDSEKQILEIEKKKKEFEKLVKDKAKDNPQLVLQEDDPEDAPEVLSEKQKYLHISKFYAEQYRLGLINHEDYLKKKRELDEAYYSKLFDQARKSATDLGEIARGSSDLIHSLTDLEEKRIENKYALKLKSAQGNRDQEALIEKQMEQEKKSARKRYADLEFVVTLAEISSRTALGVMDVWGKFGSNPILAGALSALVGATGAIQAGVANEQRTKVKNLWTGGYTGDGAWNEPKGVVHAGEFVANRFALQNPTAKRVFDLIDFAQKNHITSSITPESIAETIGYEARSKGAFATLFSNPRAEDQDLKNVLLLLYLQLRKGTLARTPLSGEGGVLSSIENVINSTQRTSR